MTRGRGLATVALLAAGLGALGACGPQQRAATPAAQPRYVIGGPFEMGGAWSYPREDFGLVETGLAAILPDQRAGRRTANGEIHDPAALVAAHRTLQLPAILRVTNLETGRQVDLRVNDRGPAHAGRVLGLSRRAAELLGVAPGRPAQVRIQVVGEASRALAAGLPSTEVPQIEVAATPRAAVEREELAPPPGAQASARQRQTRALPGAGPVADVPTATAQVPERMPERVSSVPAAPGRLVIETSSFSRRDLAQRQAARLAGLGARAEPFGPPGRQQFRVRIGPYAGVAEADRALEQALAAGVSEARILID